MFVTCEPAGAVIVPPTRNVSELFAGNTGTASPSPTWISAIAAADGQTAPPVVDRQATLVAWNPPIAGSLRTEPLASLGPLLVTTTVKVTALPVVSVPELGVGRK